MPVHPAFQPIVALIAGILILIMPRLLNYVVPEGGQTSGNAPGTSGETTYNAVTGRELNDSHATVLVSGQPGEELDEVGGERVIQGIPRFLESQQFLVELERPVHRADCQT